MAIEINKTFLEDLPDDLLTDQANIYVANYITHEAVQVYHKTFGKSWLPESFLEFYFEEYKAYAHKNKYLLRFFHKYTVDDLKEILYVYRTTFYSTLEKRKTKDNESYYKILKNQYLKFYLNEAKNSSILDPEVLTALVNTSKHLSNSDELVNIVGKYEFFMIQKIVKEKLSEKKPTVAPAQATGPKTSKVSKDELSMIDTTQLQSQQPKEENPLLVGKKEEIPDQKGKITKLFFPKLNLPSQYPTTGKDSRINSNFRSKSFMSPAKQLQFINKKKIVGVQYTVFFIEKRKTASKPKKPKFTFDF